jgi:2-polyprenyl-6-methoxyphenol hydroxylase-like FAD-dependent oxidoreductase
VDANLWDEETNTIRGDIVLVGAGTVGLFLAAYLVKRGISAKIVLVESGDRTVSFRLACVKWPRVVG